MKPFVPVVLAATLALTACSQTTAQNPPAAEEHSPAASGTALPAPTPTPAPEVTAEAAPGAIATLPFDKSLTLDFSSGAGGWLTELVLNPDGSFHGSFHDSDMGSGGESYDATVYLSDFTGRFTDLKDNPDGSWSLTLNEITTEKAPGEEWIEEEAYGEGQTIRIRYVSSMPYGLESGKDFILYGPNTPTEGLNEEFLSWWPGRFEDPKSATLDSFGLWNTSEGYGFFGSYDT